MKLTIEIPKEFEEHFKNDRFQDSLKRIAHEIKDDRASLCGRYEYELADVLIGAFEHATEYDERKEYALWRLRFACAFNEAEFWWEKALSREMKEYDIYHHTTHTEKTRNMPIKWNAKWVKVVNVLHEKLRKLKNDGTPPLNYKSLEDWGKENPMFIPFFKSMYNV